MKRYATVPRLKEFTVIVLLCAAMDGDGAEKRIRLRNETISTPEAPRAAAAGPKAADARIESGLFLIQFEDRFQPAWRETLRTLGVELVRYVPDDAFIARFTQTRLNAVKALPFVRWVGDFRPEHKIHPRLRALAQGQPANDSREIRVLLSPSAAPLEVAQAQQSLAGVTRSTLPRLGTILRGNIPAARLAELAQSQGVLWIEPAPQMRLNDEVSSRIVAGDGGGHNTAVMDLGYDGSGVTVAVADSGLDSGEIDYMHPDLADRVRALLFYGGLEDAADEHGHGTHCAGIVAGNGAAGEIDENG